MSEPPRNNERILDDVEKLSAVTARADLLAAFEGLTRSRAAITRDGVALSAGLAAGRATWSGRRCRARSRSRTCRAAIASASPGRSRETPSPRMTLPRRALAPPTARHPQPRRDRRRLSRPRPSTSDPQLEPARESRGSRRGRHHRRRRLSSRGGATGVRAGPARTRSRGPRPARGRGGRAWRGYG